MQKENLSKKEHPCRIKEEYMSGKMIEPLQLEGNENISNFIKNVFGNSGFNARRLAEACNIFENMIKDEDNTTICLTLAGAMTPIGMSGPIVEMMKLGFIDFIIATGANLYHDLHRPYGYPMKQGEVFVDDAKLDELGISRIYDVYIDDDETLMATDKVILKTMKELLKRKKPVSSAEFNYYLGKKVNETAKNPEKSLLATAYKLNIPIYVPAFSDSSIAMNIASCITKTTNMSVNTLLDVIETTAIVYDSKKNGAVEIGGGTPKNFYLQTQPMLWQCLRIPKGGHDYFIQLTTDSPQWGGLSGATPQEAKSWGKVKREVKTYSVVYSCASITFPLLCQYVRQVCSPRKQKELYLKRIKLVKKLDEASLKVPKNITGHTEIFGEPPLPLKQEDFYDEEEIKRQKS